MQRARGRSRLAFDSLTIMVVALAVFAVAAAATTKTAADRAAAALAQTLTGTGAHFVGDSVASLARTETLVFTLSAVVSVSCLLILGVALTVLSRSETRANRALRAELDRVKQASLTDYLTGLGNYRAYHEDLVRNLAECWSDGSVFTVALVDVDGLKAVNDRSGYVTGDRLLSTLARVLRSADLQSVPYRLGGDEFALAFPGMPAAVARTRMEQVRIAVEAELGGATVSIGLATTTATEQGLVAIREQAGAALDEAKRRGRNTVVAFDEIRADQPLFSPGRVAAVRELIREGTIGVAFQPIWNIHRGSLIGYEALARPNGDDVIDPGLAFSVAERIGMAHDLDRVCRNAILAQAPMLPPDVLLFLNVSAHALDCNDLAGTALVRAVEAAGLQPDQVVLEVTAGPTAPLDAVIREAARLRRLGFLLALDDTGTGTSGLEMLSRLVVDFVKIDREVIVRALAGAGGRGILAGILAIAHEMGATIIAEGVENSEMLEVVRNATRSATQTAAQGYYLGPPLPRFVDAAEAELTAPRLGDRVPAGHGLR
jgi:diguanylate cyclase (GGDEF)-like protein